MEISINGHNVDVGDALRGHVEETLQSTVRKYFDRAVDATVTFSREAPHAFHVEITAHPLRAMIVQGGGSGADAYAAFDGALDRIAKQLRRYKRRLKDHHKDRGGEGLLPAQQYVLQAESEDDEVSESGQPPVIAEMDTEIATLSVGEAVMRMDLADAPVLMFRNSANGRFNVVYRRGDGNIGWIDPANTGGAAGA